MDQVSGALLSGTKSALPFRGIAFLGVPKRSARTNGALLTPL